MQLRPPPQIKIQNWYSVRAVNTFKRKMMGQTVQFRIIISLQKLNQNEANDHLNTDMK